MNDVIRFDATCDECGAVIDVSGYQLGCEIDFFCSELCLMHRIKNLMKVRTLTEMIEDDAWVDWQIQKQIERDNLNKFGSVKG
jgi:hypothetical protein